MYNKGDWRRARGGYDFPGPQAESAMQQLIKSKQEYQAIRLLGTPRTKILVRLQRY